MPTNDVYELTVYSEIGLVSCANVFHYQQNGSDPAPYPEDDLKDAFLEDVLPTWLLAFSTDLHFKAIVVRRMHPDPLPANVYPIAETGAIAVDTLPADSTAVISLYTTLQTKKGRGRKYFSGIPKDAAAEGGFNDAYYLLLNAVGLKVITPIQLTGSTTEWTPGLFERGLETFWGFSSYQTRTILKTLRSRTDVLVNF